MIGQLLSREKGNGPRFDLAGFMRTRSYPICDLPGPVAYVSYIIRSTGGEAKEKPPSENPAVWGGCESGKVTTSWR